MTGSLIGLQELCGLVKKLYTIIYTSQSCVQVCQRLPRRAEQGYPHTFGCIVYLAHSDHFAPDETVPPSTGEWKT